MPSLRHREWLRVALVAPSVLVCYLFGWNSWRFSVCAMFVALAHSLAMPAVRVLPDSFVCAGHIYRFAIACTAVDAFFGSIPLLWTTTRSVLRNLLFFFVYFVVLSALNLARLAAGLWIFLRGVPWSISHEAFAGVSYFVLFLWIAHRRGWTIPRVAQTLPSAAKMTDQRRVEADVERASMPS
jgi:hypothetical protein